MKKYFLHDGTAQQGPFDMHELKAQGITKETSVWYEGLTEWTTAGEMKELQSFFESPPPPFREVKSPPPLTQNTPVQAKAKSSKGLIIGSSIAVVFVALMMVANNPNAVPGVKLEVNTPKPVVITKRADESKSGLFNARLTVYTTVQNQGGPGNVIVTFSCEQGGKSFDRDKSIFLDAGQSMDLDITFEEVNYIDGEIKYGVSVK